MEIYAAIAAVVIGVVALAPRYPGYAVLITVVGFLIGPVMLHVEDATAPAGVLALCFPVLLLIILLLRGHPDQEKLGHIWAKRLLIAWGGLLVLSGGLFIAIFGGAVYFAIVISMVLRKRLATHAQVFTTLAGCARQNLPLVPALQAATAGRSSSSLRILDRIAGQLEMGLPLSEALRMGFKACPGAALGAIRAAERSGQVQEALSSIEADMVDTARLRQREGLPSLGYVFFLLISGWFMLTLMAVFIMPLLIDICAEFGVPAPTLFRWMVGPTRADYPFLPRLSVPVALIGLAVLLGAPIIIFVAIRPRRPESWQIAARLGDWIKWRTPLAHWFARTLSMKRTAGALRLALEAGEPVDTAVETASCLDLNACYRRRLKRWLVRIRRGEPVDQAARAAGVGLALAWAMDEKVNPGNAPAVLEMLETVYHDTYCHRARVTAAILIPIQIVAAAVLIGWIVYTMYLPLFMIIHHTTETVMP